MFRNIRWGLASVGLAFATACTHPVVAVAPGPTPLDIPNPPPRVVVPASTDTTDQTTPQPAVTQQPAVTPRPPAQPPARPEKPTVSATAPPAAAETTPPLPLETTADVSGLEAQTRALIEKAKHDLGRVDKAGLSPDARAQYDRANGFVKQAENAISEKNLTYARNMAEKAAALASQLPKTR